MTSRLGRAAFFALVLASFLCLAAAGGKKATGKPAGPGPEEGTWKVIVTPDSEAATRGEKEFDDTLILHKGKFKSAACAPYGFDTASYTIAEGAWKADARSPKEGTSHWHGEVTGDSVSGKMTWTKSDGTVLNYSFRGARSGQQGGQTPTTPGAPADKPKNRD
jgi:hypothetical protein